MRSSRTITLFTDRPEPPQKPTSFVVSILVHGVVIGIVSYVVIHSPGIKDPARTERYTVRHLDLHRPDPSQQQSAASHIAYPGPKAPAQASAPGGKPALPPAVSKQIPKLAPGTQTLVQPNLPFHLAPAKEIPVPTVVVWTPEKTLAKAIVPPKPQVPSASDVQPSIEPPNEEVNLADMGVSSTALAMKASIIAPSTTSPLVVHAPDALQFPPATTSKSTAEPTPAAIMALSDLQMPDGTVALAPVNESASANQPGALAPGRRDDTSKGGQGNPDGGAGGVGTGQGAASAPDKSAKTEPAKSEPAKAKDVAESQQSAAKSEAAQSAASGSGTQLTTNQISLPKDGQFGVVVVGSSLEEKFPETAELWTGRMAYTVYLHVGLAKSWILQYSLPRAAEAAASGNIARIDAPWPYNIVRPNITPGEINADALMVHGFVNQAGRFESLTVAFPPEFTQSQFVLNALQQWQFRPAMQNGQATTVEVLLVIPDLQQ